MSSKKHIQFKILTVYSNLQTCELGKNKRTMKVNVRGLIKDSEFNGRNIQYFLLFMCRLDVNIAERWGYGWVVLFATLFKKNFAHWMDYNRTDFGIIFSIQFSCRYSSFSAVVVVMNSQLHSTFNIQFSCSFKLAAVRHKKARAIQFLLIYSG